ncbi:unnamed protein product [Arctogadus glacialis]
MRWRVCEYIGLLIILTHTSAAVCISSSRRSQLILLWLRLSEHAGREPEHHPNQSRCDGAVTAAAGAHWWSRLEKQTSGADQWSRPEEQTEGADRSSRPE